MTKDQKDLELYKAQEELNTRIKDPFDFAYLLLNMTLFKWQYDFMKDENPLVILRCGRQTGKTTVCSVKAIFDCYHNNNYTVICLSPSLRQSSILFDKCRDYIASSPYLSGKILRETRTIIEFSNGSRIISLPTGLDGTSVRGYTANCIICDESQAIPDKVFVAIEPILSTTEGQLILLGTPNRMSGKFFEAATKKDNGWSKYHVTYKSNPLITETFIEQQKKQMTAEAFKQEFLAEFCNDEMAFFPPEIFYGSGGYKGCISTYKVTNGTLPPGGTQFFCGIDFAKSRDKTCIIILGRPVPTPKEPNPPVKIIYLKEIPEKDYVSQVMQILNLDQIYNFKSVYIDGTGLGAVMYDLLSKNMHKVRAFNFNTLSKVEAYTSLKIAFEQATLQFPEECDKILQQFTNLHQEQTAANREKIFPANPAIHDDVVDAMALAYIGIRRATGDFNIRGVLK
jgi:phage terminase large subunit-like protein